MNRVRYPYDPKGWLKTKIFTFGVAFHFFVAGNRRRKLNMWVEHSKSQPSDDKLSLKGAWSLSRDLFNFLNISDDLGWPLSTLNHLNFYILHCLMHLRNWRSQRLQIDVKFECASHSLRTTNCPWMGRGQVMWPITKFWDPIISLEGLNLKSSNLYTNKQYKFYATGWHSTNRKAWWSWDCFKILPLVVMQRDARVCQRQLSYLSFIPDAVPTFTVSSFSSHRECQLGGMAEIAS